MTDSALFAHCIWMPATARINLGGVDYYMTVGNQEVTPLEMQNEINAAIAGSGVACAWSYPLGSFTFAAAGIFAMVLYGQLPALLGFSTDVWGGAVLYTSDIRPAGWFRNSYPIQNYRPSWHWDRGIVQRGCGYRAIERNPVAARMSLDCMIDIDDMQDFRDWCDYAMLHRACTFWFDVANPAVVWAVNVWYGRRANNLLLSVSIPESRDSGAMERLYSASLDMEVIDGA